MKRILKFLAIILIFGLIYIVYANYPRLNIITGFSAKSVASGVFIANRTPEFIEKTDNNFSPINTASNKIDKSNLYASSTVFGLKERKAIFVDGLGAILINDDFDSSQKFDVPKRNKSAKNLPYPYGNLSQKDTIFKNVNYNLLEESVVRAFDNDGEYVKKTRSVLVVYKDQIIAEKYAKGYDMNTPLLGWSMSKSITATIYGILQKQGKININDKTQIEAWENDERSEITYNDLLHMNSGLEWEENYNTISDVTRMLFLATEMGLVQLEKPSIGNPNESWNYSAGTSNLLAGSLLRKYFDSHQKYLDFWYEELIDKIGMHSAIIETDLAGNYVGSSYGWSNTRDWAKFGLLYLHRGNWNGEQIIDSTWVDYVSTPTKGSDGIYGGHFWLNYGGDYPDAPKDMYSANGFQGQRIYIIPSKDLVIVRMGLAGSDSFDFNNFLKSVLNSIE